MNADTCTQWSALEPQKQTNKQNKNKEDLCVPVKYLQNMWLNKNKV